MTQRSRTKARRTTRFRATVLALLGGVVIAGCASAGSVSAADPRQPPPLSHAPSASPSLKPSPHTTPAPPSSPLARYPLYTRPDNPAALQAQVWSASGDAADAADAAALTKISVEPTALWLTSDVSDVEAQTAAIVGAAAAAWRLPTLVAYDIPDRDCGGYSAGGAGDATAYRQWIAEVSAGIGQRPVLIVLEPDAIASSIVTCTTDGTARYALLAAAVAALKQDTKAFVYVDAGNPGWVTDQSQLADALVESGVHRADGFALNVSNFYTTAQNLAYGNRLSTLLGGAHFVVDTSRNGSGSLGNEELDWCNPPGRSLGTDPTAVTGDPVADAFLWVKQPGESDGACGRNEPTPGTWWPAYALGLAARTPSRR